MRSLHSSRSCGRQPTTRSRTEVCTAIVVYLGVAPSYPVGGSGLALAYTGGVSDPHDPRPSADIGVPCARWLFVTSLPLVVFTSYARTIPLSTCAHSRRLGPTHCCTTGLGRGVSQR